MSARAAWLSLVWLAGCASLWDAYEDPPSGGVPSGPSCYSDVTVHDNAAYQCGGDADAQLGKVPDQIRTLKLCTTKLADGWRLARFYDLHELVLTDLAKESGDLGSIGQLSRLERLDLRAWHPPSTVSDPFGFLSRLTALRRLRLAATPLTTLEVVAHLTQLEVLDVTDTTVSDLTPLASLHHLRQLSIHATNVTDLSPLSKLTELEELDIAVTGVTSLEPLRPLHKLRALQLEDTFIYDISPLRGLKKLRSVGARGVPISTEQRFSVENEVSAGRSEDDKLIIDSAGHEHLGAGCSPTNDDAERPFAG